MNILWVPHTGWHIPQRAHLFCRALSERHTVHVTDWIADFTSLQDYLSQRYVRNFFYRKYKDGEITVHGIPRISPALFFSRLRQLNRMIFSYWVTKIIAAYDIDVVVGTFVVPPPDASRLIFDLFDDNEAYWHSFGKVPGYVQDILDAERAYLEKADAVVAASEVLRDKARERGAQGPIFLIPNGFDMSLAQSVNPTEIRRRFAPTGKLVGLVGNHDKQEEIAKVLSAARNFQSEEVTFLIVGRGKVIPWAMKVVLEEELSNVLFHGYVSPQEGLNFAAALDVGLCPYIKTPGLEASSPMRLIMYSSIGLPTVCTDFEAVRRLGFPNLVLVKDDVDSLVAGIRKALALPKTMPEGIEEFDLTALVEKYESVLSGGENHMVIGQ
ncbi:glycosyltransferase [Chloroflexota bacterium]